MILKYILKNKLILFFSLLGLFLVSCQNSNHTNKKSSKSSLSDKEDIFGNGEHINGLASLEYSVTSVTFNDIDDNVNVSISPNAQNTNGLSFQEAGFCPKDSANSSLCYCKFEWTETINSKQYKRSAQTLVSDVLFAQAICEKPAPYINKQIPDGTTLFVSLQSSNSNPNNFILEPFGVKVGDDTTQLCQGKICLNNIARYSCHEKTTRGRYINNWLNRYNYQKTVSNVTTEERLYQPSGTRFCFQEYSTNLVTGDATNGNTGECAELPDTKRERTTAIQNYYFNLYIREDDIGNITDKNDFYSCPIVKKEDTLRKIEDSHWPLDVTFSLSQHRSADFSVPVIAPSKLGLNSVNIQSHDQCADDSKQSKGSRNTPGTAIASHCLGWAMKPLSNGSCPLYSDHTGKSHQTFRLRRFAAQYPHTYNTNGAVVPQAPAVDVSYVIDRPVKNNNYPANSSIKYYSMRGPKPCSFAYLDWFGVNPSKTKGYFSTNDPRWEGVNVEGISLPNSDHIGLPILQRACAATLPVIKIDSYGNIEGLSLTTTYPSNNKSISLTHDGSVPANGTSAFAVSLGKTYIRPGSPWAPHYVEDTKFEACAILPEKEEFKDAPLHIVNTGDDNFAWCAASYPTQNPYFVPGVSTANTSPTLKGHKTSASYDCPSTGICHRSVLESPTGGEDIHFPLQAKSEAIENMLLNDENYRCDITFDENKQKSHLQRSPSGACCGSWALSNSIFPIVGDPGKGKAAFLPGPKPKNPPQSFDELGCGFPNY